MANTKLKNLHIFDGEETMSTQARQKTQKAHLLSLG